MKIYLSPSWVLTDEHPMSAKGKPVLIDLGTWKVYHRGDMIGAVSALAVVSLVVEERGENKFLPEEMQFISRFKRNNHESQSVHMARQGNMKGHAEEEMGFTKQF